MLDSVDVEPVVVLVGSAVVDVVTIVSGKVVDLIIVDRSGVVVSIVDVVFGQSGVAVVF